MNSDKIIAVGREVIQIEADAVLAIKSRINKEFLAAVEAIYQSDGRVIVTGMGKSGIISQKIVSTLASTGTPAFFIHPGDALHGDLGKVTHRDIILALSNSGETPELLQLLPAVKRMDLTIIAFVGRLHSSISKMADIVLDTSVKKEACTLELAPTASTTAMLAMGDALAIALLELRGFKQEDFALLHPGGILGRRLLLTVKEIMHTGEEIPFVTSKTTVRDALFTISAKGLGVTGVKDDRGRLVGIITDGDIRRGLEKSGDHIFNRTAEFLMTPNGKWVTENTLAITALEVMEKYSITSLFVYKNEQKTELVGIVHIHDILKTGIL